MREFIANHPNIVYSDPSQKSDLLDDTKTNTYLIEGLRVLCIENNVIWGLTAVHDDHHDDSDLNPTPPHTGTHAGGFAADGWPMNSRTSGDWIDANDPKFQAVLKIAATLPNLHQIGLAGEAVTDANLHASGPTVFVDTGADHVHIGFA